MQCIVDWHRVDADPDPVSHFNAYPDPDPYSTHVRKSEIFLTLFTAVPVYVVLQYLLVSIIGGILFNIFDSTLKFTGKKV